MPLLFLRSGNLRLLERMELGRRKRGDSPEGETPSDKVNF